MAVFTYTYQGVVCIKCLNVQVIIKIACFFCSRSKCMHAHSPSAQSNIYAKARVEECFKVLADPTLLTQSCISRLRKQPKSRHWTQLCTIQPCNTGPQSNTSAPIKPQHQKLCSKTDWQLCSSETVKVLGNTIGRYKQEMYAANSWHERQVQLCARLHDHIWKT